MHLFFCSLLQKKGTSSGWACFSLPLCSCSLSPVFCIFTPAFDACRRAVSRPYRSGHLSYFLTIRRPNESATLQTRPTLEYSSKFILYICVCTCVFVCGGVFIYLLALMLGSLFFDSLFCFYYRYINGFKCIIMSR